MVNSYHEEASKSGAIIVNSCGLDSLPADLLTFLVCDAIKNAGEDVRQVSVYMEKADFTYVSICYFKIQFLEDPVEVLLQLCSICLVFQVGSFISNCSCNRKYSKGSRRSLLYY